MTEQAPDEPSAARTSSPRSLLPVILTVDDDPAVSRALARDLRRRYGGDYRIVRAEGADVALDSLREVVRRGGEVAVLLADYRMPGMNGIDFLEQAMDLFPRARRALVTAYADTEAAISAINVVDVDHYLLKPWEPPEEKFYPVVDDLLQLWRRSARRPSTGFTVIGHPWSADSNEVRDFLARSDVPYRWVNVAEEEGERLLAASGRSAEDIPVVLAPDGEPLVRPSLSGLADRAGLATAPVEDFYDVVIVGAGPAGLGAAVYGASEGLRTVVVERQAAGGQAGQSSRIENYLGFPDGVSGQQLTDRARRQAQRFGAELVTGRAVTGLEVGAGSKRVLLDDGSSVAAHTVVLATGVAYRQLEASGVSELTGRGVFYGSSSTFAAECGGRHVVIVGGANSAGQSAVFFSRHAAHVTLAVRGPDLERSMSSYLISQVRGIDNISVRTSTTVVDCRGDEHLECVTLRDALSGTEETVATGHVFVFIGAAPYTDWLPADVHRDPGGFVRSGADLLSGDDRPDGWDRDPFLLETSVPGIFVAGDVRSQSVKRVASAVGEGALAITLVHRYLESS